MKTIKFNVVAKRVFISALVTLMVIASMPVAPVYGAENVNFTIAPEYINIDQLPTVVTVTADKSAFTVGSAYPTLINSSDESQSVSIVDTTATTLKFTVPAGLDADTYTIRISDPEGDQGTTTKYYEATTNYVAGTSSVSMSETLSLAKAYATQTSATATGQYTSFSVGQTTVELVQNNSVIDSATVTAVSDSGSTQTITFTVGTGLSSGTYDVRFTTGDDQDTVTGGVVVRGTPTVSSSTTSLSEGYSLTNVTITGTNTEFGGSTSVQILDESDDSTGKAGTANVVDEDTLTFSIGTGLSAGTYKIRVTTGVEVADATLTVYEPSAVIRTQSENTLVSTLGAYYPSQNLKLIGTNTNFSSGTTSLSVFKGTTQVTGAISGTPTVNSSTEVLFSLAEWSSSIGTGDIKVVATTGDEVVESTFSVADPSISLTYNSEAVEDDVIAAGYKVFTIDVDGTNTYFTSDTTVEVEGGTTSNVVYTDSETLSFQLTAGLSSGTHTVTIDFDGTGSETNTVTTDVTVGASASLTSISPSNVLRTKSSPKTYTIYGSNTHFEAGTPSIDIQGTSSETISNIDVVDNTTLTFDLVPSSVDTDGDLDLQVTVNSSSISETVTLSNALSASSTGVEATPDTFYTLEKGNATISITAEGFTYDSSESNISATFDGDSVSVTRVSNTQIQVTLPNDVTAGSKDLTVTNNSTTYETSVSVVKSQIASKSPAFKVYGYTSNDLVLYGNTTVTFTAEEPSVRITGDGVDTTLSSTGSASANSLTITLPDDLTAGLYDLELSWSSGDYEDNSLTVSNYEVKHEIDSLSLYFASAVASNKIVYLNGTGTLTYSAIANVINGSGSTDKTTVVNWSSSDTAVATISSTGTVTVVGRGSTTIAAAYDDQTSSILLSVNGPDSIDISGSDANIRIGESETLTAVATYGDSSTETITSKATWGASNTNVDVSSNVVTGQISGQTVVSAAYGGATGTLPLTVSSIDITPSTIRTLEIGNVNVIIDGIETGTTITSLTVGGQSVTTTDDGNNIQFAPPSGLSAGNIPIVLVAEGQTHNASLLLVESTMSLSSGVIPSGNDAFDMVVTLKNADVDSGTNKPVVTIDNTAVTASTVSVNSVNDTVTFPIPANLDAGSHDITLSFTSGKYSGNSLTKTLTVSDSITYALSGTNSVRINQTTALNLTATADGNTSNVTSGVTWSSANENIATVSDAGVVTGINVGTVVITATYGGSEYTMTVSVTRQSSSGGSSSGGSSSGGSSGGSSTTTTSQRDLTPEQTKSEAERILDKAGSDDVLDVVKALNSIRDSSLSAMRTSGSTLEDADKLANSIFEISKTLNARTDATPEAVNQAATDMAQIIGVYVARPDVSLDDAKAWSQKVIGQVSDEVLNTQGQSAQDAAGVATEVLDNVIVRVIDKGLDSEAATDIFENYVTDVARKALILDSEKIDSYKLLNRMAKASIDIVEVAGRVDTQSMSTVQDGNQTVVNVDREALIEAAQNAAAKASELGAFVSQNTSANISSMIKPRLSLELPDSDTDLSFNLDAVSLNAVKSLNAEVQVNVKGASFLLDNDVLNELENGIQMDVGSVGTLEQNIYMRDMPAEMSANIGSVDHTVQVDIPEYEGLDNKFDMSLAFDQSVIENPSHVNVFVYDEEDESWTFVKSEVDASRGTVTFTPPHFSMYTVAQYTRTFEDVSTHWSKEYVEEMASRGLTSGISDTMFGPDQAITRAQFATLLVNALDLEGTASANFTDVNSGAWYYESVNLAAQAGLVSGTGNGRFEPNAQITREQMAVMIAKAYVLMTGQEMTGKSVTVSDFDSVSDWAKNAVQAANYQGVISGFSDGTFKPGNYATRAHGVVMLKKLLDLK